MEQNNQDRYKMVIGESHVTTDDAFVAAESAPLTTIAKLGYTQIAATFGNSGYSVSKSFTRVTNFVTDETVSVELRVVRSMALKQRL